MVSEQVKELHQLRSYFSEGKATPAHIKRLSELIVLMNSNSDEECSYNIISEQRAPEKRKRNSVRSF